MVEKRSSPHNCKTHSGLGRGSGAAGEDWGVKLEDVLEASGEEGEVHRPKEVPERQHRREAGRAQGTRSRGVTMREKSEGRGGQRSCSVRSLTRQMQQSTLLENAIATQRTLTEGLGGRWGRAAPRRCSGPGRARGPGSQ